MSIDEIRTQKALALLEFVEAGERQVRADDNKDAFVKHMRAFLQAVESGNSQGLGQQFENVTVAAALEILEECRDAKKHHEAARAKKIQFGL